MPVRVLTLVIVLTVAATSCSDDASSTASTTTTGDVVATSSTTTTTVPERPTSTTTTVFDPASVEGQVEAAYLKSWDVYAEAVYNLELDEEALAEVYAETSLTNLIDEVRQRINDGRAALVDIDHNYEITISEESLAFVVDAYRNHQVLIDPVTKEPLESDPDEDVLFNFTLRAIDGSWRVVMIERVRL